MVNNNYPRPSGARPIGPVLGVIAVLLLLGGFGYYIYQSTRPVPATVERRDIIGYVAMKGDVVAPPSAYAEARPAYSASVDKVYTTLGGRVARGDVLVQLANPSANETYQQARQNVRAAETAYANAKKQYDDAVSAARKQLDSARAAAQSTPPATSVSTDTSSDGTTVTSTTSSSTSTTYSDTGDAALAVKQAEADRTSGLAAYQQQLDEARAAYRDARAGRRMSQVRAPITGTVIALNAAPGQTVGQNDTPVAIVCDLSALTVRAGMSAAQAALVRPGQAVVLTDDSVPNHNFDGKVRSITTLADPNSTSGILKGAQYIALIGFDNTDGLVKPSTVANVSVKVGEVKNALAAPVNAVTRDDTGRPTVKVLNDGKWQPVVVETGLSDGRYVEIKNGLKVGQTVQVTRTLAPLSKRTQ